MPDMKEQVCITVMVFDLPAVLSLHEIKRRHCSRESVTAAVMDIRR